MKIKLENKIMVVFFAIVIIILIVTLCAPIASASFNNACAYECDVHALSFTTNIDVSKDSKNVYILSGNFHFITDPIILYDTDNNVLGDASDEYYLIKQDTHIIHINNEIIEMAGEMSFFGDKYTITKNGEIYIMECNMFNTKGTIFNSSDELVAEYRSTMMRLDYNVYINNDIESNLTDEEILLIMASYYSDYKADSSSSSSSSRK